jgi:hypothetical protein
MATSHWQAQNEECRSSAGSTAILLRICCADLRLPIPLKTQVSAEKLQKVSIDGKKRVAIDDAHDKRTPTRCAVLSHLACVVC